MSKIKTCIYFLLLLLLSGILSFALFIGIDLLYSSNYGRILFHTSGYIGESHAFGWYELKKNFRGYSSWGDVEFPFYTDDYGYRVSNNSERSRHLYKNVDYIFLGDSFTLCPLIWEECFIGDFQKRMRDALIVNAGTYSYSPSAYLFQYEKALQNELFKKPHRIIVGLDISDVQDEAAFRVDGITTPINRNYLIDEKPPIPDLITNIKINLALFASNNLILTSKISHQLNTMNINVTQNKDIPGVKIITSPFDLPRSAFTWMAWSKLNNRIVELNGAHEQGYAPLGVEGGLNRIKNKLNTLSMLAKKNGGELYLLIYPWPAQLKYYSDFDWPKYVKNLCKEIECKGVINTFPTFQGQVINNNKWYEKYYFQGDIHLNAAGNQIISDALINYFQKNVRLESSRID